MLDFGRPDHRGDCEREAQPEFVAKHGHGMTRAAVVALVVVRHLVSIRRFGCGSVGFVHQWSILLPRQSPRITVRAYPIPL
jgi:hypothetical protein